jgi:hypothetical protein
LASVSVSGQGWYGSSDAATHKVWVGEAFSARVTNVMQATCRVRVRVQVRVRVGVRVQRA